MVLPRKCLFHYSLKVGIEATDREVGVSNGRLEVVTREEALAIAIEEVVCFSKILRPDQHPLRDDRREELIPMYLSVAIYVNRIKEVLDLLLVVEVGSEILLHVFNRHIAVILFVYLKEHFSEPLSFLFINLAPVGNNVLNTLTEKQGLAVILHSLESRIRHLALGQLMCVH